MAKEYWIDIRNCTREQAHLAFQQERMRLVRTVIRDLWNSVESYNANQNKGEPIPMSFNFTNDMKEMDASEKIRKVRKKVKATP